MEGPERTETNTLDFIDGLYIEKMKIFIHEDA